MLAAVLVFALFPFFAPRVSAASEENEEAGAPVMAEKNRFPIFVDGKEAEIKGYIIDGRSYYELRDLEGVIGFYLSFNEQLQTIEIDTSGLHKGETALQEQIEYLTTQNTGLAEQQRQMAEENYSLRFWLWLTPVLAVAVIVAVAALIIYILVHRNRMTLPMRQMEDAVAEWPEEITEKFRQRILSIPGEPGGAAKAILRHWERAEEANKALLASADQRGEQRAQERITREICGAFLPPPLSEESLPSSMAAVAGYVHQGAENNCVFFDHFTIIKDKLCFSVGQIPGHDSGTAMLMAVTQIAIRTRLRSGRGLADALSDVNTLLFELSNGLPVQVIAGVLNLVNGNVCYVNAGGTAPLLMRGGGTYEWVDAPVSAALGQNESISYREETLSLRQGDRLFFYTEGLGEAVDREGTAFLQQQFRSVLNRSRGAAESQEEVLRFVEAEASAFCEHDADLPGYASLSLEYRRGTKEFAYCEVRPQPSFAAEVTEFLKRRCQDYRLDTKSYARLMVVVDELFALCCRRSVRDAVCRVECSLAPDGQMLCVRVLTPLGGKNPLENPRESTDVSAVAFIRENTEYTQFEPGEAQDTVSVIYALGDPPV